MLPNKTLTARSEKEAAGMKKQKELVTLMACSNATGSHKLPLMFVGKAANPCCFKNVNKSALPVVYYSQKNAWVNCDIFSSWFHSHFVPAVTRHMREKGLLVKALLLLDNAPVHLDSASLVSTEGDINAMFLPANTTALVQPMDQGVLEAMKRRYRKSLLQRLLLEDQEGRSIIEFCKKINIKDVVYMAAAAWDDVLALTLAKSWRTLMQMGDCTTASSSTDHVEDQISDQSDCEMLLHQLDSNLQDEDISNWVNGDADDQGYQLLSDEEIIQQVNIQQPNDTPDHHEEDEAEDSKVPNSREVA